MKNLISIFAILAMVFSMQSCIGSGDTPDNVLTFALKGYNHINEPAKTDAPLRNKAAKYTMEINMSQMTMTLQATGAFTNDGEEVTLVFSQLPIKYNQSNGGFTFSTPAVTPTASNGKTYNVTNLSGSISAYAISNADSSLATAITVLQISYSVDDQYNIFATLQTSTSTTPQIYYTNCSTTTSAENVDPFTTTVTTYLIDMTSSTEANVTIASAQFAQKMPQMTMVFPKVPVEMTTDGYVLKADEVTPTINDTPMPAYKVTNFRMETSSKGSVAKVTFNCNIKGAAYTTTAACKLLPDSKQDTQNTNK